MTYSLPLTLLRLPLMLAILLGLFLTGCANEQPRPDLKKVLGQHQITQDSAGLNAAPSKAADQPPREAGFYQPGSGQLIAAQKASKPSGTRPDDGEVKLNFQNANLLEVIKVVLGDMLSRNYVVDAKVQGTVNMQTSRPLRHEDLLPTLEMLLRMNGAALVRRDGLYRVVPMTSATGEAPAPQLGDSSLPLPRGYSVRVVPLKYITADEMSQILQPFTTGNKQVLQVDRKRNLLILAGSGDDMGRLLETIRIFDVSRMAGMSVALFTPEFVDAKTLGDELQKVLADKDLGLLAGLVRFEVIERLNGLLVITPRSEHLAQVRRWVRQLDRDSGSSGQRLFIYRVQNGKAGELASVLNQLFKPAAEVPKAKLAPGLKAAETEAPSLPPGSNPSPETAATPTVTAAAAPPSIRDGLTLSSLSRVKVIADEPNNALLILANSQDYRDILTALKQLDAVPLQVLIEVTIAEVSLTDNLSYGVEWFFKHGLGEYSARGTQELGLSDIGASGIAGATTGVQGFSYALTNGADVLGLLNLLDKESNISIISSPSLLVLNNKEARIQVGDEISIKTAEQSAVTNATNTALTSTFERRETGVMLSVKPRVNPGGLVIIEVEQEVSNVPQADIGSDNPRIQQRKITSSVAIQSGDSVILGGLIKDNRDNSEAGVPGIRKVPVLGTLFGTKANNTDRTELLVLITPHAISDRLDALRVTEDFRDKLDTLLPARRQQD